MKISKFIKYSFAVLALSATAVSCSDDNNSTEWWWSTPADDDGKTERPRFIWVDAAANFPRFADSKENIAEDLQKAYDAGFTDIVVDVRPTMGDVLFQTSAVDQVKKVAVWEGGYHFHERTANWDYLQAFIDEGHKIGLKIHAAINTFTGGNKYLYNLGEQGILFRDASKKDWATVLNVNGQPVNVMDYDDNTTKFFNPANDDVQNFVLSLLGDLAKYKVDGIFLDRCRFDGENADYSDVTKKKFEDYIGKTISGDFIAATKTYEKEWIAFRAKIIHDFVVKARDAVKAVNKDITFGTYVGAWYSTYYTYGVNWASNKFNAAAKYNWASPEWNKYGYADHLDFMLLGAYASADRIYGSGEWSCQGFCQAAKEKLCGDVKFAGGPDVGNGSGWTEGGRGDAVTNSVDACIHSSNGYFIFDMVHVRMYDYWKDVKAGVDKYKSNLGK